ncbi:hypothetical protein FB45DRAFT_97178 [Roridomyces roridus]|uniref:Uncharacterized protein n=1 Tax=Roridomyces roridus TaxID=1738132 RepID=A0AAD7BJF2_9AGAR|nr:hypothetical protein FB45DRAFT_97178 [Roridomyces roridus]
MGRPLFSERYGVNSTSRVEPEPVTSCPSKWSIHARFDPDSDEFFEGAVFEAFTDKDGGEAVIVQPDTATLPVPVPVAPAVDSAIQEDATEESDPVQNDLNFERDFLQWFNPEEYALRHPAPPTTPPSNQAHLPVVSPSPPGTVTPRIYMWPTRVHVPASPSSPTARQTHPGAHLLANSAARQSLARLPTRRRVQNV